MKINAISVCVSALLLVSNLSFSQKIHAQESSYRLQDLYQQAIKVYPGLQSKKEKINALSYEKKQINTLQLPQVALQLQNTYGSFQSTTGSVFPMPGMFNISGGEIDRSNGNSINTAYGSVVADWTIYSFGKIKQQKIAANQKVGTAVAELSAYELHLKSQLTQLYLINLYYHAKYKWAVQNSVRMSQIMDISSSYADAGLKPGADTLLVSSTQSKINADVLKWKGKLAANAQHIEEFLQAPFATDENSERAFLKNRPALLQSDSFAPNHPYLSVIESEVAYFDALEKTAARATLPSASLLGGVSMRSSGIENGASSSDWAAAFNTPGQSNYLIGVGIKWNMTDGYQSKLNKKRIQHEKFAVSATLKQKKIQLQSAIQAAQANLKQELIRVINTEESVEKARTAYELYNTRYESGLLNLTELLQIQSILQETENDQIEAYQELWNIVRIQSENTGDFSKLFSIF